MMWQMALTMKTVAFSLLRLVMDGDGIERAGNKLYQMGNTQMFTIQKSHTIHGKYT